MLLEKALNNIKNLRGTDVEVFGQPYHIDDNTIEYKDLVIDIIDVFENLKDYEVTSCEYYNEDLEEYEEIELNSSDDFISYMENIYGIKEIKADNSYNWGAPVSNNFYMHQYYNEVLDEYYYVIAIHKYGDVRGNYTNEFVLKFDNAFELLEALDESNKYYTLEDNEGNVIYFDLRVFSEGLTYEGGYNYRDLNLLDYENIDDIQKDILNEEEL